MWQFPHTGLRELPIDVGEPAVSMDSFPTKFARNWDTRCHWLSTTSSFSCRGDLYFVVSAIVFCSLKCSCFYGVDETHCCFAVHDHPFSSNMYSLNWSGSSMHSN